jgi:hypothetical protein
MELVVQAYPEAEAIRVVLDNLNTHTLGALYEAFSPEKAHALLKKLEFHYTPKHGHWLNMAEIEFSALSRQCLSQRTPDIETLKSRSTPGKPDATKPKPVSIGNSQPARPVRRWPAAIPHNQLVDLLVVSQPEIDG